MIRRAHTLLAAGCLAASVLATRADVPAPTPDLPASVRIELEALRARIPEADRYEAEGLVADRRRREIVLFARATGLRPNEPAEFVLIGPQSVHDYEALAITFAMPSEIARAIEFIGLPRGEPALQQPMSFWPRGERLLGTFDLPGTNDAEAQPLESLLQDRRHGGETLPARGMIYGGSRWTEGRCAADDESPGAVLSTYNEPTTVMDFPHMAGQADVYERFAPHPDQLLPEGALLRIRLEPEPRPDARPRVERYEMRVAPAANAPPEAEELAAISVSLSLRTSDAPTEQVAPAVAFSRLRDRVAAGFDPYVTPVFADSLTLRQARAFSAALEQFEGPNGLRVEAPPEDQLYYRAFIPHEQWRARDARAAQPWELRVSRSADETGDAWKLTLLQIREQWRAEHYRPDLETLPHALEHPGQLADRLAELGPGLPVILVFAPPETPLKAFMPALRAVHETHPTVHVFSGQPLDSRPPEEP